MRRGVVMTVAGGLVAAAALASVAAAHGPSGGQGDAPTMGMGGMPMTGMGQMPMTGMGQMPMMGMGQGFGHGPMGGMRFGMALVDRDDDGRVSEDEAAAHAETVFIHLDDDSDGALDEHEFVYRLMAHGFVMADPRWRRRHEHRHQRFAELDGDGDGRVSKAEFMTAHAERYAAADGDGDGAVTVWEFRARQRY